MRKFLIAAALIVVAALPAFAESGRNANRSWQATSHEGYGGRHRFGTDPDPNVQFEIRRQRNWRKG